VLRASTTSTRSRQFATLLLVAITAVWGSTFFLIRDVVHEVPPTDFLAVRFTIAAVAMIAVFWRPMLALDKRQIQVGIGLGILYAVAQILQTIGLAHTDASRSGFITGTYVVLTPLLAALLLRERISRSTWLAVLLATAGLATMSLNGFRFGFGFGESVTLLAAGFYALHIIGLGRHSSPAGAAGLSAVQMVVIAVVSLVAAAPGGITLPQGPGAWGSVLYMALVAGALAIWAQTWAQSHLAATRAAIVMTLEPVLRLPSR
jgi:drug/metabolite transporter (DMT)-like permease